MAVPMRQRILEAFMARIQQITVENGYETDAGSRVYLGETPELGEDDPINAIAIIVGDTEPQYQGAQVLERLPVEIQALAKADLDQPYIAAEVILGDIVRAVEQEDRTLGGVVKRQIEVGPTRTMRRESGMTTVGISITYYAPFTRVFGRP